MSEQAIEPDRDSEQNGVGTEWGECISMINENGSAAFGTSVDVDLFFHVLMGLIALHMDLEPNEGKLCTIHSIPTSSLRPRRAWIQRYSKRR